MGRHFSAFIDKQFDKSKLEEKATKFWMLQNIRKCSCQKSIHEKIKNITMSIGIKNEYQWRQAPILPTSRESFSLLNGKHHDFVLFG